MVVRNVVIAICVIASNLVCDPQHQSQSFKTVHRETLYFEVRIRAFRQNADFGVAGVDYIVEARTAESSHWSTVMEASHDDGIDFGDNNIIFAGSSTGFVYLVSKYAVTFNGGKTWEKAELKNIDPTCIIDRVEITERGKGEMSLTCSRQDLKLHSSDFGISWNAKSQ